MSNRMFLRLRRPLGGCIVTAALLAGLCVAPAAARDRGQLGVAVAPDLANEWLLQLSPGSGVVPGYHRPDLARRASTYDGVILKGRAPERQPVSRGRGHSRDSGYDGYTGSVRGRPAEGVPRAMNQREVDPAFLPQVVDYKTREKPGTIVIDTTAKYLYLVDQGGKAHRYGVGVGKPGFEWAGVHKVTQKKEWPTWTPPAQMRARERAKGKILPAQMAGGPQNPLGARAMYLGSTLYRIHGTNQPWTIGKAMSSGCIRMRNEDVTDLYGRVPVGTRVIVL
ncbi:L,D-transpeptidase [Aureimonas sp. SA4125]|uniref:L,D-transpeptidase n=1 Tax=Aureimonas sp. SA4125 TaxID=2826993 RepID=UPI001CC546DF|nr:L,D-transpeptidase [Aureimonas sp. SA4125]BDA82780.1 L,D-transpeptidase [Aureimonas sp. SA4125]